MQRSRYPLFLYAAAISLLLLLPSCKEKNDEFPPRKWYELSYLENDITLREISAVFYENDHSLWLGAKGTEGLLYNNGYEWVEYNKQNTGISFDSVTAMTRDGNGKIWIGHRQGLATFSEGKWASIAYFNGLRVTSLAVEGIGRIRVGIKGTSGGVATFDGNNWSFEMPENSSIPSGSINALASDNEQVLWAVTSDKGVIRLKNSVWENISSGLTLLSQNFTSIAKSPDGSIWAGSDASQLVHFYEGKAAILNTGTSRPINSLTTDSELNIWIGTDGAGILQYDGFNWKSYTMANAYMPSDDVSCLTSANPGYLMFVVPGGKLCLINP